MSSEASQQTHGDFVLYQGRSALFIACVSMGFLFCVLALSVFLWTSYGAITAFAGLITLFSVSATLWFRMEKRDAAIGRTVANTPIQRFCFVGFWCVSSFVLLMVVTLSQYSS